MKPGQGIVVDRLSRARGWAWPVFLLLLALLWGSAALAQQSVPALTGRVMDGTGTLNASQVQQIDSRLAAFEASRGTQIVVLLVATTQPEDIASFANRVANSWKIGRRDVGDGLLLVVAVQDRKVRVEVAKTLEGAIPDLAAKRVIDTAIVPRFREGDFAGGIDAGVAQIMALVAGEALPLPAAPTSSADEQSELAILLFFLLPLAAAVVRRALGALRAALVTGGLAAVLTYLVTSSLLIALGAALVALMTTLLWGSGAMSHRPGRPGGGWAGGAPHGGSWRGGGSGGGGFSSGGGGDFGGGGASGDW